MEILVIIFAVEAIRKMNQYFVHIWLQANYYVITKKSKWSPTKFGTKTRKGIFIWKSNAEILGLQYNTIQ